MMDALMRAPLFGSMLMCLGTALVGVIVFVRRRSLVGEALSHAAYPGIILCAFFGYEWGALVGAFVFSLLGLWVIETLEGRFSVKSDAALCFVLSGFLGVGVLLASRLQSVSPLLYQKAQTFLFGQAVTMHGGHVAIYGVFTAVLILWIISSYRQIEVSHFDPIFSRVIGVRRSEWVTHVMLALAIVIGMRSVGVVLMAGMLIAPALAARQWTQSLTGMFCLAGLFGAMSGFGGVVLSERLPTGPMILLVAALICVVSMGVQLVRRGVKIWQFRMQVRIDNAVKAIWRYGSAEMGWWTRVRLRSEGWYDGGTLTEDGRRRALHIVRLHRLWEVYLTEYLGVSSDKVHRSAEEMEHILTPEIEATLVTLLKDPKTDPHEQPIPEGV